MVILDPATIFLTGRIPLVAVPKSVILDEVRFILPKLAQLDDPSPILKTLLVRSYPGSPLANIGLAEVHAADVPLRICIRSFTAIINKIPIRGACYL